jgi:predicted RNase H-like nuclease (RuvC/YqgF family)
MFSVTLLTGIYLRNKINYSTGFADADEAERLAKGRKVARRQGESAWEYLMRGVHNMYNPNDYIPAPDENMGEDEDYLEAESNKDFNDLTNPDDVKILKSTISELRTALGDQVRENKNLRKKIDLIEYKLGIKVHSKGSENKTERQKTEMIKFLEQKILEQQREEETGNSDPQQNKGDNTNWFGW